MTAEMKKYPPEHKDGVNISADFVTGAATPEWRTLMARLLLIPLAPEQQGAEKENGPDETGPDRQTPTNQMRSTNSSPDPHHEVADD